MESNIVLIRHAHTYGNLQTNRLGYNDDLDNLTPQGIVQSLQLSPEIYRLILSYSGRIRLFCSESRRTLQTAIFAGVGHFPIQRDSCLNEFETDCDFLSTIAILARKEKILPPSLLDVQRRMINFLVSLDPTYCNLVFSHGASIATVYHAVDPAQTHIPRNATLNTFNLYKGNLTLH